MSEQKPLGRGARLYQALLEKRAQKEKEESETTPSVPRIGRGRASNIEKLIKLREAQKSASSNASANSTSEGISTSSLLKKFAATRISPTEKLNVEPTQSSTKSNGESSSTISTPSIPSKPCSHQSPIIPTKEKEPVIKRATPGKNDRVIPSTANYIRLNIQPGKGVYEYEVRFKPDIDHRGLKSKILGQYLKGPKTFDGTVLYLPDQLSDGTTKFTGKHPINDEEIEVSIIFKRKKRLGECIHLYNIMFRRIFKILEYAQLGRQMFDPSRPHRICQHKLEIWPGYVTAVDEYEDGIMLCIDCSHRVLRTDTVRSHLANLINRDPRQFQQEATKTLIGQAVLTKYNNKLYRIDDILWDKNPTCTFENRAGGETSYTDYYKRQHGIEIRDLQQPLLVNRAQRRTGPSLEKVDQLICLIPELCYMTGLTDEMRNNFTMMKDVAMYTRITPSQRKVALQKFLDNVRNSSEAQELLNSWGLSIASGTIDLEMRVLAPETILFGGGRSVRGTVEADWTRASTTTQVICAIDIKKWYLLYTPQDKRNAEAFKEMILQVCGPMGMRLCPPQTYCLQNDATGTYVEAFNRIIAPDVQIVVIICPTSRDDRYSAIKKICCADKPIPSQVINSRTLSNPKRLRTVIQKIALQMNCKLGGQLWAVNLPKNRWMICGIDVYHDAQRSNGKSVAGFVASLNQQVTRWYSQVNYQEKGEELCNALKTLFISALQTFHNCNGAWPSHIFIFRDGVGDGQLKYCQEYEIPQLMDAIRIVGSSDSRPDQIPKLTYIVVQKRINTRLFLMEGDSNPEPGSIIDHTITRRDWYDFFLVPQNVRQGTVSPTHYVVVQDQSDLSVDHVQKLTFKMCHLYYNWSGTIRVPAPCQYAHKLAYLVGQNIHKIPSEKLADRLYYL